ncbi:hypothetical protein RSSM_01654 [Rhodopirellula sallentina SM41]|uniref:Uncharacterized protein n=1 Tax=Rhodopirellula sallentina SM41 TaxID=1263870 RepID=M5U6J2_9BACT|nr:hypothetical protein RSSM_01654 [Rhodopirellula sallentina SM41]
MGIICLSVGESMLYQRFGKLFHHHVLTPPRLYRTIRNRLN